MMSKIIDEPIQVSQGKRGGPYIMLPLDDVPDVRNLLDEAKIHYWVSETSVSQNNGPMITIVHFNRAANSVEIQAALDKAS